MSQYIPSPSDWVAEQVRVYEESNGVLGTTLRDTGMPVIIVTNQGRKTGAIRKTPLMKVADGDGYVASMGGAPENPLWYHNLIANSEIEIRDFEKSLPMRARLIEDEAERARLWALAVIAYPPYEEYQERTERVIPVFRAETSIG
jgi:deazaflavin-dependent oxidoreductase (nitroreductase family)